MGEKDIALKISEGIFNYRVGAIIIDSNKILMVKNSGSSYYYTVGGRVKFGESAQEAILREAYEETKIQLEIERLAFIHDKFFVEDSTSTPYHEICLFFLIKPNNELLNMKHGSFNEEYGEVSFYWLPINGINDLCVYPEFFKSELTNLSQGIKYFITRNGITVRA